MARRVERQYVIPRGQHGIIELAVQRVDVHHHTAHDEQRRTRAECWRCQVVIGEITAPEDVHLIILRGELDIRHPAARASYTSNSR